MQKVIYCFIALLFYCFIAVTPVGASDSWKSLPPNTCPSYPVVSACNLTYIMETNVSTLGNLVSGANAGVASGIGLLYQVPPVSGRDYLAYIGSRFHVPGTPTTAYAAAPPVGGVGYNSLGPVLKIWVVMRNLAYLVFAVIFIVIGIMILIRSKIDPKTTVDIQNALPKIVLALVLVTFSYAIAGFLIDIMYVVIALILTIIKSMGLGGVASEVESGVLSNQTIMHFLLQSSMWATITSGAAAVGNVLDSLIGAGFDGNIVKLVGSGLAFLIILIAICWALVKTWFMLISAYANIILGIIFSPLQLMVDAIPGQNQFDGWLRNMLANILSFPTVIVMIFIGMALATNTGEGVGPWDANSGFVPPLIGGSSQVAIQAFIGIGIILTIPKAVEILQEALKAPKSKWGSAWGEAVGWAVQKPMAGAWNRGSKYAGNQIFGEEADRARAVKEAWLKQEAQEVLDAAAVRRAPIRNPAPQRNINARIGQAVGASKG